MFQLIFVEKLTRCRNRTVWSHRTELARCTTTPSTPNPKKVRCQFVSMSPYDSAIMSLRADRPVQGLEVPTSCRSPRLGELSSSYFRIRCVTLSCLPTVSYQSLSRRTGLRIVPIVEEVDHTSKVNLVPDLSHSHTCEAWGYGFRLGSSGFSVCLL